MAPPPGAALGEGTSTGRDGAAAAARSDAADDPSSLSVTSHLSVRIAVPPENGGHRDAADSSSLPPPRKSVGSERGLERDQHGDAKKKYDAGSGSRALRGKAVPGAG